MKSFIFLVIPFIVFASGEAMRPLDHLSLHGSNHRPSIKMKKKMQVYRLRKVKEEQAEHIVKKSTGEPSTSLKLTHKGKYLIYKVTTKSHYLVINALDGTVIKQESREDK